jgi:hypothetical protein
LHCASAHHVGGAEPAAESATTPAAALAVRHPRRAPALLPHHLLPEALPGHPHLRVALLPEHGVAYGALLAHAASRELLVAKQGLHLPCSILLLPLHLRLLVGSTHGVPHAALLLPLHRAHQRLPKHKITCC